MKTTTSWPANGGLRAAAAALAVGALLLSGCSARGSAPATEATDDDDSLAAQCDSYEPTAGIADDVIKIGTSLPVTGALATGGTVRYGAEAYFAKLNDEGGLDGRAIEYIVRDDAYDPSQTTANVNELVNQDRVFGLLGLFGTANILAVQPDLQAECIPNLLPLAGAPAIVTPEQTWTLGLFPSYTFEAAVLARAAINSGAKTISIISQNDDFGRAYVDGLKQGLEGSGVEITRELTYDVGSATVDAQVTQLADDDADAVLVAALGTKCPQIMNGIGASGWAPQLLVGTLCTSKGLLALMEDGAGDGLITTAWDKSPSDPIWADDPGMQAYREAVEQYIPGADPNEDFVLNGWLMAELFVALVESSPDLTRASVMETAHNADLTVDSLLPGIRFQTTPDKSEPIPELQLQRYDSTAQRMVFIDPETGADLPEGEIALTGASR